MLKSQYCVHTRVQFTGHPLFVPSSRSIPISGAEMQSFSLLEVRQLFSVFCVVTRVHEFDVRLVTNKTPNTERPEEQRSYRTMIQDSWF
jgi:hypothetical protein